MSCVIGIDVGGSTTKIVGFREDGTLINPMFVRATDPVTSIYGAFGRFTVENAIELKDISRVMMTGVGSAYVQKNIYGLPCISVSEFTCVGLGGLYISGLDRAIIISMGTGTALTHATRGGEIRYLGGTGVGGGTLMGISKKLLGLETIESITEFASRGSLDHIDLRIKDITKPGAMAVSSELTAANFGKVSDTASKEDMALGLINMVFETVAMMGIFAARSYDLTDIVLTGNLTSIPQAADMFPILSEMLGANFIIPEHAQFATVIGAALSGLHMSDGETSGI